MAERRRESDARIDDISASVKEALEEIKSVNANLSAFQDEFKTVYKPYLDAELLEQREWRAFWKKKKQEAMDKGVTIGVLGVIGLLWVGLSSKIVAWAKSLLTIT